MAIIWLHQWKKLSFNKTGNENPAKVVNSCFWFLLACLQLNWFSSCLLNSAVHSADKYLHLLHKAGGPGVISKWFEKVFQDMTPWQRMILWNLVIWYPGPGFFKEIKHYVFRFKARKAWCVLEVSEYFSTYFRWAWLHVENAKSNKVRMLLLRHCKPDEQTQRALHFGAAFLHR